MGRFEFAAQYGFYTGQDFVNSHSYGGAVTYNITNQRLVEASVHKIVCTPKPALTSCATSLASLKFQHRNQPEALSVGWVPIYVKFSFSWGMRSVTSRPFSAPAYNKNENAYQPRERAYYGGREVLYHQPLPFPHRMCVSAHSMRKRKWLVI